MFTHFATADEADDSYAKEQIVQWRSTLQACKKAGLEIPILHISNSAGILQFSSCEGNMVRLGISMYGYYPSSDVSREIPLRPALRLLSRIAQLKLVSSGTKISYGGTFETSRDSWIATLPIGYADGYSRAHSNQGVVLVRGVRVPVVGRVCMDQLMIDVTDVPGVQFGDEVVLYGKQGTAEISLEEVAERIGTITYEVCCALGRRVPRCYQEADQTLFVRTM
jgi:alanine racemase